MNHYSPASSRYTSMPYNRCGRSGLQLPVISLGLWHNFGGIDSYENGREMVHFAFDHGITHFDLANNYGPPPGSSESNFGRMLATDLKPFRDELIISSKAGYRMGPGPYGDGGSRKYLISSLDQSLQRMGLDYVDIFYHHSPDPDTPLEETMSALDAIVRSGKALYIGVSNYSAEQTSAAAKILRQLGTPCVIHQPSYNMFNRSIEKPLLPVLEQEGIGCIVFSPLAQGMLTNKYLKGIPTDSRAAKESGFLKPDSLTKERLKTIANLNTIATRRNQTLAQMAIAWTLRHPNMTSAILGASKTSQIKDALGALEKLDFSEKELREIEDLLGASG